MEINYEKLKKAPRLLIEAKLEPLQGNRFQPTGFADLGAARYSLPDGTRMLLVESAQSVANRMELACCKDDRRTQLDELKGLPYVASKYNDEILTTSYLEAHRLSSPYLLNPEWAKKLSGEMQLKDDYQINDKTVTKVLFKYDPCSLLHGVWLGTKEYKKAFSGGRVRLTRTLSGFIEAMNFKEAESGGTKFDKNAARLTETGSAETGYGTLPFHRIEFTAEKITAYFNLDLALLRGYGLEDDAIKLLIALSLFKIRRFLSTGLRLRTACNLEVKGDLRVTRPDGFEIPKEDDLLKECKSLIGSCKSLNLFPEKAVTEVIWTPTKKKETINLPKGVKEPEIPDDLKKMVKWKKETKKAGPKLELSQRLDTDLVEKLKTLFPESSEVKSDIDNAFAEAKKVDDE